MDARIFAFASGVCVYIQFAEFPYRKILDFANFNVRIFLPCKSRSI